MPHLGPSGHGGVGALQASAPAAQLKVATTQAQPRAANLTKADLTRANLTDKADLTDAYLVHAVFRDARLMFANLTGATMMNTNFTDATLTNALCSPDAVVPRGWQRDDDSGRLKRDDTD